MAWWDETTGANASRNTSALTDVVTTLITATSEGLYCEAGGFHIDPWRPVERALITHAHADHARPGHRNYLTSREGRDLLRLRLGQDANIDALPYRTTLRVKDAQVSFHPAGHILGASQIRIESEREVCVVSGDYKLTTDPTCAAFETVPCQTFVSECTFGLPIYRWPSQATVFEQINRWWSDNRGAGRASIIFAYALGKAQRILAGVDATIGPIFCHGATERVNAAYRASGVLLPSTTYTGSANSKHDYNGALILAPPSAMSTSWRRRFGDAATAFASGWMRIRGMRRRRSVDRGFVLSDHADWPDLISAIESSQANEILLSHGPTQPMARWLREHGHSAEALPTEYVGERDDMEIDTEDDEIGLPGNEGVS